MHTQEEISQFEENMKEIVVNIAAIKGKTYMGAVMLYMNTLNMLKLYGPSLSPSKEVMYRRKEILDTYLQDTIERIVDMLFPTCTYDEFVDHMCEFAQDVDTIHSKQRELNDTLRKKRE